MSLQEAVTRSLRAGVGVADAVFDQVYPRAFQKVSPRFWSPVQVGITAAEWLRALECKAVVDIGAGVGKFCIVTSLALDQRVTGLEQRGHLLDVASRAASEYAADVEYVAGTLETIDPERFDGFYLFNPFAENVLDEVDRLDAEIELSEERLFRDLARVEEWLDLAPQGVSLATYNGFGGRIPETYRLRRGVLIAGNWLRVWTKGRPGRASGFYIEVDEVVLTSRNLENLAERLAESGSAEHLQDLIERPLGITPDRWQPLMRQV